MPSATAHNLQQLTSRSRANRTLQKSVRAGMSMYGLADTDLPDFITFALYLINLVVAKPAEK